MEDLVAAASVDLGEEEAVASVDLVAAAARLAEADSAADGREQKLAPVVSLGGY